MQNNLHKSKLKMSEIYSYPKELKKLRACIQCSLIKTEPQVCLSLKNKK